MAEVIKQYQMLDLLWEFSGGFKATWGTLNGILKCINIIKSMGILKIVIFRIMSEISERVNKFKLDQEFKTMSKIN